MRALQTCLVAGVMLVSACGTDSSTTNATSASDGPTIVVSTNIMGDVVQNLVGDAATVVTIMPVGADPHDFQPSARQIAELNDADAVVVNGGGFEEGLLDIVEAAAADGIPVFEATTAIETLEFVDHNDEHEDDDHSEDEDEDEHGDEDDHSEDEDEHGHQDGDPHFFSDPVRMASAAGAISEFLIANIDGIDADAVQAATSTYLDELAALDEQVTEVLGSVSPTDRVLVTNHEVLSYFADRYDFEIIGTVIPGGTTVDSTNAGALAELASIVKAEGIPAVFSDTSSSSQLAETLALEVGDVEVVALYSESLGPEGSDGSTYIDMMLTNAERIAEALS